MVSIKTIICGALAASSLLLGNAAFSQPDFTGVWGIYRAPGATGGFRRGPGPELPLTEYGQQQRDEYRALIGDSGMSPGGMCLGYGMPGSALGAGAYPMQWVQHEDIIMQVFEAHSEVRRIYIGENVFPERDLFPDRNGYSEGHWEGDTLVVTTTHLQEQPDSSYPHSEQTVITERYSVTEDANGARVMTLEMTLVDPVYYTEPVTTTKQMGYQEGGRILPYECNEFSWYEFLDARRAQLDE